MSQTNNEDTYVYIYHGRDGENVPVSVTNVISHRLVTQIPDYAFYEHERLETIKFYKGVTSIGESAFKVCVNLKYINLHETSVETIDECAFQMCFSLKVVKLPPSLKTINRCAFGFCTSLIIINLSTCSLLEVIDECTFFNCTSLIAVYFPKSLQRIGKGAFFKCYSLIYAELSPTVQVHNGAFIYCSTLELRQPQVNYNSLTPQQKVQKHRESIRYLKQRFVTLPIHNICCDTNTALDRLQFFIDKHETIRYLIARHHALPTHKICSESNNKLDHLQSIITQNDDNINYTLQQTDEFGMTALHLLCLNPNETPEMSKLLVNAFPL